MQNLSLRHSYFSRGFSLIELLISMVIAGIILAGVVKIAFNAKRSSFDGEQLSFVQDNARFVLEMVKREVRIAGYSGCAGISTANKSTTVVNIMDGFINLTESIQGYDGASNDEPDSYKADVSGVSDSFIVRFADASKEFVVKSHNESSAEFTLWENEDIAIGSTLLVADATCRELGLFQVSGPGGSSKKVLHAADGSRNCTRVLRSTNAVEISCADACSVSTCGGSSEVAFNPGSTLMPYNVHAYYIGESAVMPGMPALKKQVLTASGGVAVTETEELAIGVEDMQVVYGVDVDDDAEANQYLSANDVSDWGEVVSMRLTLVFRSAREVYATGQQVTLKLDGSDYSLSSDRFMRQVITTSVKIRNN